MPPDRTACEQRVYRLATLLTGNATAATRVIRDVLDAQPDLHRLDSAHLDRLTVLRSREVDPGVLRGRGVPAAGAVAGLRPQEREAWVFAKVYGLSLRDTACAMDCSLTALRRHLELAEAALARVLGEAGASRAAIEMREYALALDVPSFARAKKWFRRGGWRRAMAWVRRRL